MIAVYVANVFNTLEVGDVGGHCEDMIGYIIIKVQCPKSVATQQTKMSVAHSHDFTVYGESQLIITAYH